MRIRRIFQNFKSNYCANLTLQLRQAGHMARELLADNYVSGLIDTTTHVNHRNRV
jgi:hypothetical protein